MKKIINITVALAISLLPLFTSGQSDPPSRHGVPTDQKSGSAPIGGGVFILLGLGAAYGGKKYFDYRKKMKNEMDG